MLGTFHWPWGNFDKKEGDTRRSGSSPLTQTYSQSPNFNYKTNKLETTLFYREFIVQEALPKIRVFTTRHYVMAEITISQVT